MSDREIEYLERELEAVYDRLQIAHRERDAARADLAIEADISNELRAELAAERERADKCEREENARWLQAIQQRDKLREALEPFARVPLHEEDLDDDVFYVKTRDLRRARVVLKETGGGDE